MSSLIKDQNLPLVVLMDLQGMEEEALAKQVAKLGGPETATFIPIDNLVTKSKEGPTLLETLQILAAKVDRS
jgi:hypothetical protein